jgi:SAM-dependent methyltransferase
MLSQLLLVVAVVALVSTYLSTLWGAPWAPTPMNRVDRMLRLAAVQPGETVVDLGSGDGRIVIRVARRFGARAVGVEIDPLRWFASNVAIRLAGVAGHAQVVHGDMFAYDLGKADVVTLYLLDGTNQRLRSHLAEGLRPGARIVSHRYRLEGWTPVAVDGEHQLFLYQVGSAMVTRDNGGPRSYNRSHRFEERSDEGSPTHTGDPADGNRGHSTDSSLACGRSE